MPHRHDRIMRNRQVERQTIGAATNARSAPDRGDEHLHAFDPEIAACAFIERARQPDSRARS